jgi:hypothetical protein
MVNAEARGSIRDRVATHVSAIPRKHQEKHGDHIGMIRQYEKQF